MPKSLNTHRTHVEIMVSVIDTFGDRRPRRMLKITMPYPLPGFVEYEGVRYERVPEMRQVFPQPETETGSFIEMVEDDA